MPPPPPAAAPCCRATGRARCRAALLALLALFVLWHGLGLAGLRTDLAGHAHAALGAAGAALTAGLYAPDAPLVDEGEGSGGGGGACPARVDVAAAFAADGGPRLWLWWTAQAPGALPGNGGSYLEACHASALRHAASAGLRVTLVNSSATRGPHAPYPLRRFPLPPYFDALPVNHQGDFGSFALLAEYGGLYLDTDVLVLHSLAPYLALLARYQFVGFGGHIYDEGVHHGLMAARPGAEVLARAYAAALAAYEREGGCAGATCAHVGGLRWLSTLDAFSAQARAYLHGPRAELGAARAPCAYARLPTRHYEPGMWEHQDMCAPRLGGALARAAAGGGGGGGGGAHEGDAQAARYLASTMAAALSGVLRVVHLSSTKSGVGHGAPLEACPLLAWLVGVSEGRAGGEALARAVAARAVGAWQQTVQDFAPL
jgi:hypothetical protein